MIRRLLYVVLIAAVASPAMAATAGPSHWLGVPVWIWATLNLIVFWGVIGYFAGPPIKSMLRKRKADLRGSYSLAREQEREIAAMKESLERQLAELRAEVDAVAERSAAETEKEREQIIADAQRESARLIEQAEQQINTRVAQAKVELLQTAAAAATKLAEQQLQREVSPADRSRLFENNVRRLQERAR